MGLGIPDGYVLGDLGVTTIGASMKPEKEDLDSEMYEIEEMLEIQRLILRNQPDNVAARAAIIELEKQLLYIESIRRIS